MVTISSHQKPRKAVSEVILQM